MSFSYKKLLLTVCVFSPLQAHSKNEADYEPAPPIIQQIGKEAQEAVGVKKLLPIMVSKKPLGNNSAAFTTPKKIVTCPTILQSSYAKARCILFHEAIHAKYEDPIRIGINELKSKCYAGLLSLATAGLLKIIRFKNRYCFLGSLTLGAFFYNAGSKPWRMQQSKLMEKRADREGLEATKCESCVREAALHQELIEISCTPDYVKKNRERGYISAQKKHAIAEKLKGKLCTFHAHPDGAENSALWINAYKKAIEDYKAKNSTTK